LHMQGVASFEELAMQLCQNTNDVIRWTSQQLVQRSQRPNNTACQLVHCRVISWHQ